MIHSSDGKQYETPLDLELGRPIPPPTTAEGRSEKPAGASKSSGGTKVAPDYDYNAAKAAGVTANEHGHWPDTYKLPNHITFSDESIHNKGGAGHWEDLGQDKWSFTPGAENLKHHSMDDMRKYFKEHEPDATLIEPQQDKPLTIVRSHDVPLAASALHKDGKFYGIAIDKDAPIMPGYDQYIHKHESDEFHYMKDLITNGMHPTEAYHKAHDHIAPMESARVQADLGEKGLENYKQYWRDVAKVAGEKEDPNRHPDAHTTTYNLDDAELGKKFKPPVRETVFRGIKGAATAYKTATDATYGFVPINPMTSTPLSTPGGKSGVNFQPWFRGAEGKLRQEIPDNKSKLTVDKAYQALKDKGAVTVGDALHHPELYESYPSIKDIKIFHDPAMGLDNARYQPSKDEITVGPHSSEAQLHSTLLHEIQHAIQTREGFTAGTSPKAMLRPVEKALKNKGIQPLDFEDPLQTILDTSFDAYKHVGGEVEARNVEKRKDYPDEALRMFKPTFTQDYPFEKQLNPPID